MLELHSWKIICCIFVDSSSLLKLKASTDRNDVMRIDWLASLKFFRRNLSAIARSPSSEWRSLNTEPRERSAHCLWISISQITCNEQRSIISFFFSNYRYTTISNFSRFNSRLCGSHCSSACASSDDIDFELQLRLPRWCWDVWRRPRVQLKNWKINESTIFDRMKSKLISHIKWFHCW